MDSTTGSGRISLRGKFWQERIMVSKKLIAIFSIVLLVAALFYFFGFAETGASKTTVTVARVIDGDTFELANGKSVRLLGIDAPERGQSGHGSAKNKLKELILGKTIVLEKDVSNVDGIDRLLRYIFVDDLLVNLELVRQGYANVYVVSPDKRYEKELIDAEAEARDDKRGIWKISDFSDCISISNFHYNAKGKDNENLNDEYVVLKNTCDFTLDMKGWVVKDRTSNAYVFPSFELGHQEEVTLHSGSGTNTGSDFFWKRKYSVWSNNGDTLYLRDGEGNLVLVKSYSK